MGRIGTQDNGTQADRTRPLDEAAVCREHEPSGSTVLPLRYRT